MRLVKAILGFAVSSACLLAHGAEAAPGAIKNIVLVHGAFVDGSSWAKVTERLQKDGYRVAVVQNPLTSLADDVEATRRVLLREDGPTLLVGHSWGGAVITQAGADAPNVVALVYIAALAPDVGESVADVMKRGPSMLAGESISPARDGFLWITPVGFARGLGGDIPSVRTRVLAAMQQPIAAGSFDDKVTRAAWRDKPSWYAVSTEDKAVSPALERWMAQRMGAHTIELHASHLSPVSQPDEIALFIEHAAAARDVR